MSYEQEIGEKRPTCYLFVIDQSGSMEEIMDGGVTKAKFVADVTNKTIQQFITACRVKEGETTRIKNRYDIGILGYGNDNIASGFGHGLASKIIWPLSDIGNPENYHAEERTVKESDGQGGIVDVPKKFPVWYEPKSSGNTPMRQALTKAAELLVEWCDAHPENYPPTLIHVTDGESTDGDPEDVSTAIKQLHTNDGECLFFNLHVSKNAGERQVFPVSEDTLPDSYGKLLFRMSSTIPEKMAQYAAAHGIPNVTPSAKFFAYKADIETIVKFYDIGTRANQNR